MEQFLQAPDEASVEILVDAYNTVIKWVTPGDERINIAEAILTYMSSRKQYQNVYSNIYLALSEVALIRSDDHKRLEYITMSLKCASNNAEAHVKLYDVIPKTIRVEMFMDVMPYLHKSDPLYDIIIIYMFAHAHQYKDMKTISKTLDYVAQKDVYKLLKNTYPLTFPCSQSDVAKHLDTFISTLQKYTRDPKPLLDFLGKNKCILMEKIGFHLTYISQYHKDITKTISSFFKTIFPRLANAPIIPAPPKNTAKIKIGFLSAFLRDHTIGTMFGGVIKSLDRDIFETYLYNVDTDSDKFVPYVDHFVSLKHIIDFETSILEWQKRIIADGLDILVYPEIGMNLLVYLTSLLKLARTQIVWWGHPESPCTNMDYFISSEHFNDHREHYHEKLLKMKSSSIVYSRPNAKPDTNVTRAHLGLPEARSIYMCIQTFFKYSCEFDDALHQILEKDPQAQIVIVDALTISYYRTMLTQRWQDRMPVEVLSRIQFAPRRNSLEELLTLVQHADVLLDTFPFSGSTTHLECFSIGKPVVTMNGTDLRGSLCSGIYRRLGIENAPIAQNVEEYVHLAIQLANNRDVNRKLQQQILHSMERFYDAEEEKREWNELFVNLASVRMGEE